MEELYKALLEELSKISELAYIDLDMGQLEFPGEFEGCPMPWCLIDFEGTNWQDIGQKVQDGDVIIKLRIASEPVESTSNITPALYRNKGIEIIRLWTDIYKKLYTFSGTNFNAITRTNELSEKREDGIKVRVMYFKTNYRDFSAIDAFVEKTVELETTVELD